MSRRPALVRTVLRRPRTSLRAGYSTRFVILLRPLVIDGKLRRGILWVMGNAEWVTWRFPDVRRYFVLISSAVSKRGWAPGQVEDIHGLTLSEHAQAYRKQFPNGRWLVVRNADFIDEREFYPVAAEKTYDVLFNSTFSPVKRHELFLSTLYDLRENHGYGVRAAVIAWSAAPRLLNSVIFPPIAYRAVRPLLENGSVRYARLIRQRYENAIEDGLAIDILRPVYRSAPGALAALRLLNSRSKVHVLLSETEGCNRATKEAILCDVPVLAITGSVAAKEFVTDRTGVAVGDSPREISEGLLHLLNHHDQYAPREWALENCPRAAVVERLWWKVNEVEEYPGYPSIETANEIRRAAGAREEDNHTDLNNWHGAGSSGSLATEMQRVRQEFGGHANGRAAATGWRRAATRLP